MVKLTIKINLLSIINVIIYYPTVNKFASGFDLDNINLNRCLQ